MATANSCASVADWDMVAAALCDGRSYKQSTKLNERVRPGNGIWAARSGSEVYGQMGKIVAELCLDCSGAEDVPPREQYTVDTP